jgi:hypothetical protein
VCVPGAGDPGKPPGGEAWCKARPPGVRGGGHECEKREYEMARLAWDVRCGLEAREGLWGWAV